MNNKRNSIDVDKFDYLRRDAFKLKLPEYSFNSTPLLKGARIMDNQLCYPISAQENISDLFKCRYNLFKNAYLEDQVQGADIMV